MRGLRDGCGIVANYAYFPILADEDYPVCRDDLYQELKEHLCCRGLYPLIFDFPIYSGLLSAHQDNLSMANNAAFKVPCLPAFPALKQDGFLTKQPRPKPADLNCGLKVCFINVKSQFSRRAASDVGLSLWRL
jgi:hypothetical protein